MSHLGQPRAQFPRGIGGVAGLGDRAYDDDPARAGGDHFVDRAEVDPSDREPRPRDTGQVGIGGRAYEFEADGGAAGLRGRRPHGSDAEVVESGLGAGGGELVGVVGRQAQCDVAAENAARSRAGQVALAEVQDGRAGDGRDISPIVDGPQSTVPLGDLAQDAEVLEFLGGFERLVAQLHDVDAAGVGRVDELGEVPSIAAGISAQVEPGGGEQHAASVSVRCDTVVIGGGVVGLSIAWELARTGRDVRLIDPEPASGATYAAAGMITPISEHRPTEQSLHVIAQESAARYPAFLATIPGGGRCGFEAVSTLLLAVDDADRRRIDDLSALQPGAIEPLTLREARRLEPLLGPRTTAVRRVREHRIDPRALATALLAALGDRIVRTVVRGILHEDPNDPMSPAIGVRLDDAVITAREVVVANGLAAGRLDGMPFVPTLRPVYGDILRLGVPDRLRPLLDCTVRARVHGASVYLLPRIDGTVVLGATQREHGGPAASAGGVYELLRDAAAVVPAVAELELLEVTARARPTTPDNAPLLGRAASGLIIATGFGRHGVMLAPIAAEAVASLISGVAPTGIAPFRPDRFTASPIPLEVS